MLGIFLDFFSRVLLRHGFSLNWGSWIWLVRLATELQGSACLFIPRVTITDVWGGFDIHGFWDLSSGPHACMANNLLTKPFLS